MTRLVVLDNEAVQALADPTHSKHRKVIAYAQVVAQRRQRRQATQLAVPTSVRAEAGLDRTAVAAAFFNRLNVMDEVLDTRLANTAAAIRARTGISVADAHLGAVIQSSLATTVSVITSDPLDLQAAAGDVAVTIVVI